MLENVRSGREPVRMTGFGALALVGCLCGCGTAPVLVPAENKTEVANVGAAGNAVQTDFAIDPIDVAQSKDRQAKSVEVERPWRALQSISFFYSRADLSAWESTKVAEIVDYLSRHPEAEVGINRPSVAPDGDPDIDDLNHRRVRTIINGLLTAGVSEDRIQVGNYVDLPLTLDQRVEVLTRKAL